MSHGHHHTKKGNKMLEVLFFVIFCWIVYAIFMVVVDFIKTYKLRGIILVLCGILVLYGIMNLLAYFNIPGEFVVIVGEIGLVSWLLWELFTKCTKQDVIKFLKGIWK